MFAPLRLIASSLVVLFFLTQCQQQDLKVSQKKAIEETHVASLPQSPLNNGDGFWVIAHRGVSGSYPENTLSAFQAAIDIQAEMVEAQGKLISSIMDLPFPLNHRNPYYRHKEEHEFLVHYM